ncbi:MAG TPA: YraN family protein [Candidatus Cloacimonadota bacterium]|nr:YraN family protein [Candidatus Cloacimonadota bacterium]HOQ80981.1 YraN family protein [Candidatus Cloacimonadota bacterium]HPK40943.1 YraN family protein [Candidatus Cloacimonadota bacterium]HPY96951.1 YraN family protein [Candidatus Cloacimonadota bacterium]HQB41639.1 YraN family protein [Candidatus Cloacimonadota bacterium]
MNNKSNTTEKGKYGEELAIKYLIEQSYEILERNYTIRGGEIDIIARNGDELAFIEVKFRTQGTEDDAVLSITKAKQKRISKAALLYLATHDETFSYYSRFDTIIIIQEKENHYQLNHYKNAFESIVDF